MRAFLVLCVLLTGCAHITPPHKWPKRDIALATVFVASSVIDWRQTAKDRGIFTFCDEMNPMLGKCGDRMPIQLYFPMVWATFGTGASALGGWYRTGFLGALAAVETENIHHNQSIGYGWW